MVDARNNFTESSQFSSTGATSGSGGKTNDVNFVDTVCDLGVNLSSGVGVVEGANEIYDVKRVHSEGGAGGVAVAGAPQIKRVNAGRKRKEANFNPPLVAAPPVPVVLDGDVVMADPNPPVLPVVLPAGAAKQRQRTKARRLAVKTNGLNIWDTFSRMNAGLSILDWLAIGKDASRDLIDGLQDLRLQRPKRAKQKYLTGVKQGLVAHEVKMVDAEEQVGDSDAASWYHTDSDSASVSGNGEVSMVTSVTDSNNSEYELDDDDDASDIESVYRYPYDINRMKIGSPLKGVFSINGVPVKCVFDSGASVSVISKYLCEEVLHLVPNGNNLQLVGFDNKKSSSTSNIVMDVPIMVAGKIRPEHMCVQDTGKSDRLCLLGVPWFQAYGIEMNLVDSVIKIPTTSGLAKLQCYTTHLPSHSTNQIQRVAITGQGSTKLSLNERFRRLATGGESREEKGNQVYTVQVSQKYCATLEDAIIPYGRTVEEVKDEFKFDATNITEGVCDELKPIIEKYKHCFSEVSGLSKIKGYELDIQLKDNATPIKSKSFRLTWEVEEIMNQCIDEMLELDLIEESKGVWTSPCFLVGKKDGSKRCVIDYRKVNEKIIETNFPMCTVSELTEATAGANYFTSLDLSSGYHQLEINPNSEARSVTGFITKRGVYQYKVLPSSLL